MGTYADHFTGEELQVKKVWIGNSHKEESKPRPSTSERVCHPKIQNRVKGCATHVCLSESN